MPAYVYRCVPCRVESAPLASMADARAARDDHARHAHHGLYADAVFRTEPTSTGEALWRFAAANPKPLLLVLALLALLTAGPFLR